MGYLPSGPACKGAGESMVSLSTPGAILVLAVEHVLEGDFLAGVGGHAAHGGHQAGLRRRASPRCRACRCGWRRSGRSTRFVGILLRRPDLATPRSGWRASDSGPCRCWTAARSRRLGDDRRCPWCRARSWRRSSSQPVDAAAVDEELRAVGEGVFHRSRCRSSDRRRSPLGSAIMAAAEGLRP